MIGEVGNNQTGFSVSAAGDVNGDGLDDVIVGARILDVTGNNNEGAAYVVFGSTSPATSVNLLDVANGTGGFRINGEIFSGYAGSIVSAAGDVNGDGFDDVVVGAPQFSGDYNYGAAYVVFGSSSPAPSVALSDVSNGTGGFRLLGSNNSAVGISVSGGGDINGNGFADLIIGDDDNDAGGVNAGAAYVVFGTDQGFAASSNLDTLAAGTGGFKITGEATSDFAGFSVSTAGDVDGDGFDDLLIGADLNDGGGTNAGSAYLVFGASSFANELLLSTIAAGTGGIRLTGEAAYDQSGSSVGAAGDINGDGFDDLIVGAPTNDEGGSNAGAAYFLFGLDITGKVTQIGTAGNDTLTGTAGVDVIVSGTGDDLLIGNGGADVLRSGSGDDDFQITDTSFARIDGGLGVDAIEIQGSGVSLDLTAIGDTKISGVEEIDLTGSGNNSVTLSVNEVNAASDNATMTIIGDAGDAVVTTDIWEIFGAVNVGGETFQGFESLFGNTTLLVDLDVDISGLLSQQISTEPLSNLDAEDGFKIIGETGNDFIGSTVSFAGDLNNDGLADVIVGGSGGESGPGDAAYVVFGSAVGAPVDLDNVAAGTGGFKINAEGGFDYMTAVSGAGDMNGDGIDDVIVGAYQQGSNGAAYVIFGTGGAGATVNLSALDGTTGFKIIGEAGGDQAGYSVSAAGDVNGDGFDDVIVGARLFDVTGTNNEGAAYVVFGTDQGFAASINLSDVALGSGGFRINGEATNSRTGTSVSAAGDVNGDGFDDLIVGANQYGAAYVVFGSASFANEIELSDVSNGTGGFRMLGYANAYAGNSVSNGGDVNGDGIADLIVGASRDDDGGANFEAGAAYVVFGTDQGFAAGNLDSLGTGGFKIVGETAGDFAGNSISSAGDVNGDGLDDILVGAYFNDAGGLYAGSAYVVFGTAGTADINLDNVALGTGGFRITGEAGSDYAGRSVSAAGDVDGDGFDDILIGASHNDAGGGSAGAGYVLFGFDFTGGVPSLGTAGNDTLTGSAGVDIMNARAGDDFLFGNGGADVLRAGAGDDDIIITDASFARIDGGSGNDFLQLSGGFALDLTAIGDTKITGIESVEFTGAGASTLTIAVTDVQAMSDTGTLSVSVDTDDTLSVADDTVALAGVWEFVGSNTGGTLAVHQVANGATVLNGAVTTLTNEGFLSINSDQTLEFTNSTDILSNAAFINLSNSTLTVDTGTVHNLAAGTISGGIGASQIATVNGGVFQNDGTLNFGASPGAFTVDGNLSNGDTASMLIELGGLVPGVHDGFDQLTVTGVFGAGGTINVVEFGGFEVSAGDSFAVVETGSISGSFDDIVGLDVGGGVVLDATQSASGVSLTGMAVTHQGTAAGDTLTGGSGDDVFVSGDGGDFVIGGGGADLMHGGAGDDVFVAADTGFGRIDGGDGFDTVRFDGAGQSFDLGGLRGDQINAIEAFDLTGNGDNTLTLDADMVLSATRGANALTGTDHSLIIDGDAGDAVDVGEGWSNTGTVTVGGDGYSVFENGDNGAQLYVDNDVAVVAA